MKKIKKILTGGLAALCLWTSLLTTTACSGLYVIDWSKDVHIYNGERYVPASGFSENFSERVTLGYGLDGLLDADVTDVDRNFIYWHYKFATNNFFIKESMVEEISDIKKHKMDEIYFSVDYYVNDRFHYDDYTYQVVGGFTFKEIMSDQPTPTSDIPQEMIKTYISCDFVEYPLSCWVDMYSNGEVVYVILTNDEEYYEITDEEFKDFFLEIYEKEKAVMADEEE